MIIHIAAGTLALISGVAALAARKGNPKHRMSGKVFVIAMLVMAVSGSYIAFRVSLAVSIVAGMLTAYLVATSFLTIRRRENSTHWFDGVLLAFGMATAALSLYYGFDAAGSESGIRDEFPATVYFVIGSLAIIAAAGDVKMLYQSGSSGTGRIVRHLWRMCFGLFIATASLFLGQPQVFPEALRQPLLLAAPVLMVLATMAFWIVRVRFTAWGSSSAELVMVNETHTSSANLHDSDTGNQNRIKP